MGFVASSKSGVISIATATRVTVLTGHSERSRGHVVLLLLLCYYGIHA